MRFQEACVKKVAYVCGGGDADGAATVVADDVRLGGDVIDGMIPNLDLSVVEEEEQQNNSSGSNNGTDGGDEAAAGAVTQADNGSHEEDAVGGGEGENVATETTAAIPTTISS